MATSESAFAAENFGSLLKFLRRRAGLTQRELSIAVGYSEPHISRLEQNQRLPDLATIAALFVPALELDDDPALAGRLLELAALARGEPPPRGSLTVTRAVEEETVEETYLDAGGHPGNLPVQHTSFVGREAELDYIVNRLWPVAPAEGEGARLLTLVGPGGTGKTRLALMAAERLRPGYAHGAWFVDLAPLRDPALAPQAVVAALGLPDARQDSTLALLTGFLRQKRLLLVLDNCEHMVEAAARLAEALVYACPGVRFLATSREALSLGVEETYRVPPLNLPPTSLAPEAAGAYEAPRLFIERAQALMPAFALSPSNTSAVVSICRQLEGIPLAIEMAAARINLLTAVQIAARLHDHLQLLAAGPRHDPRHRTLRATIDWSYNLLDEPERRLLQALSVFAGGWSLEAAESVNAPGPAGQDPPGPHPPPDTVNLLTALVNKSLVVVERPHPEAEARFRMLESIRQYAHEKLLSTGGWQGLHRRHWSYFLAFAETAAEKLRGPEQAGWLKRLETEHDNLRAALTNALAAGSAEALEAAYQMAYALAHFWFVRGYHREKRQWIERCLESAHQPRSVARAHALAQAAAMAADPAYAERRFMECEALCLQLESQVALAHLRYMQGATAWWQNPPAARARFEESARLYRAAGDSFQLAAVLAELGELAQVRFNDRQTARAYLEESLALAQAQGNKRGMAIALAHLGDVLIEQGDLAATRRYCEAGLQVALELNDNEAQSWALNDLGLACMGEADYDRAAEYCLRSLTLAQEWGNGDHVLLRRYWLARVAFHRGRSEEAVALLETNLAESRERSNAANIATSACLLGALAVRRGDLAAARRLYAEGLPALREFGYLFDIVFALIGVAELALALHQPELAARLLGASESIGFSAQTGRLPVEQADADKCAAAAQSQIGAEAFAAALAEGRALSPESAIALAFTAAASPAD